MILKKKKEQIYIYMPELRPCICGHKSRAVINYTVPEYGFVCPRCGLKALKATTHLVARENWNKMVEELSEGEDLYFMKNMDANDYNTAAANFYKELNNRRTCFNCTHRCMEEETGFESPECELCWHDKGNRYKNYGAFRISHWSEATIEQKRRKFERAGFGSKLFEKLVKEEKKTKCHDADDAVSLCDQYLAKPVKILKVIFDREATIVCWEDGSKTVIEQAMCESFDPDKNLALAIAKKYYGNDDSYQDVLKKWIPKKHRLTVFEFSAKYHFTMREVYQMINNGELSAFRDSDGLWIIER